MKWAAVAWKQFEKRIRGNNFRSAEGWFFYRYLSDNKLLNRRAPKVLEYRNGRITKNFLEHLRKSYKFLLSVQSIFYQKTNGLHFLLLKKEKFNSESSLVLVRGDQILSSLLISSLSHRILQTCNREYGFSEKNTRNCESIYCFTSDKRAFWPMSEFFWKNWPLLW